jgi:hypothetical protein
MWCQLPGNGPSRSGRGVGAYLSYDEMYILELSLIQVSNTSKFELGPRHQSGFNVHLRDLFFGCVFAWFIRQSTSDLRFLTSTRKTLLV